MTDLNQELSFSVEDDGSVYVHVRGGFIIPFANLENYTKFATDMLAMVPEITDTLSWQLS